MVQGFRASVPATTLMPPARWARTAASACALCGGRPGGEGRIAVLADEDDDRVREVQVEVTPEVFSDKIGSLEALQKKLIYAIDNTLGIHAVVSLVQPHTIERSMGKAKRVIDNRKM